MPPPHHGFGDAIGSRATSLGLAPPFRSCAAQRPALTAVKNNQERPVARAREVRAGQHLFSRQHHGPTGARSCSFEERVTIIVHPRRNLADCSSSAPPALVGLRDHATPSPPGFGGGGHLSRRFAFRTRAPLRFSVGSTITGIFQFGSGATLLRHSRSAGSVRQLAPLRP